MEASIDKDLQNIIKTKEFLNLLKKLVYNLKIDCKTVQEYK